MTESHIVGLITSGMQFIVVGYALLLNRRFGTAKVGWSLFGAFSFLALLQLEQSTTIFSAHLDSALKTHVIYAIVSFLLLVGMLHLETMLKERAHLENVEKKLRADLELEVKAKTAHLTRALDELMLEIEATKRMTAIIESAEWGISDNISETIPAARNLVSSTDFELAEEKANAPAAAITLSPGRNFEMTQLLAAS